MNGLPIYELVVAGVLCGLIGLILLIAGLASNSYTASQWFGRLSTVFLIACVVLLGIYALTGVALP